MIDLETLVHKTMELESKYYELLETHQQLVHEYESFKNFVDTHDPRITDDYETYCTRRGMEAGSVQDLGR